MLQALNLLRANLEFSPSGAAGPTILVTSALTGEGKTTVAANLGSALALSGHRVICVEADVRRPALRRYLGLPDEPAGLIEVLNRDVDVVEALQIVELAAPTAASSPWRLSFGRKEGDGAVAQKAPLQAGELRLLPIGGGSRQSAIAFNAERFGPLLEELRSRADFVILDSSPLLTLADSLVLAQQSDDVLVVARQGHTKKESAEAVRAQLRSLGVEPLGVILTDSPQPAGRGYY
jgi:receptor protein-tyrosine kinase